jgi:Spy/CpxP family protein refolding chaperone
MLRLRSTALVFVLAASIVPLAACSGATGTSDPPQAAQNGTTTAALNVTVHGPAKRVADALATVPLRADQRATIEQMGKDAETRMEPARKARADLMVAIADQVQAGKIDRVALQPKIDALTAAHQATQPGNRAAFEKLHDLLTPDQRVAFVNAMQTEHHQGGERGEGMRGRMQKWATDLGLSQDQKDQIKTQMQARWEAHVAGAVTGVDQTGAIKDGHMMAQGYKMHEQYKAMLEAFKGDTFKMDQVAPVGDHRELANGFAGHMLGMLETSLPILTPDQRTIAASKLREHATKFEDEEQINEAPAAK